MWRKAQDFLSARQTCLLHFFLAPSSYKLLAMSNFRGNYFGFQAVPWRGHCNGQWAPSHKKQLRAPFNKNHLHYWRSHQGEPVQMGTLRDRTRNHKPSAPTLVYRNCQPSAMVYPQQLSSVGYCSEVHECIRASRIVWE